MLHLLPSEREGDIRILSAKDATVSHRRWLRHVRFALEGLVASEVGIPCLSHILMVRSRMK